MPNLLVIMMESAFPDASGQLLFFEVCAYAILVAVLTKFLRKRARPVAHPEDIAKLPALDDAINRMHGQEIGHLDLSHLPFRELPSAIAQAAPTATSISLCIAHPNAAIDAVVVLKKLKRVTIVSDMPLPRAVLDALARFHFHGGLVHLDLAACRVKDSNNSTLGVCSAKDVHDFVLAHCAATPWVRVPALAALCIGHVTKVFQKQNVIIIKLSRPLRVGDVIEQRRVNHAFSKQMIDHEWHSAPTLVLKILTDDHDELPLALPVTATVRDTDGLYAVKVQEAGRRGDMVFWTGRGQ
eukprot:m.482358 g.482358  ORF g.482358 m.482358 type:complete len:297 (-) comp21721_c1_seq35:415-1305(-)